jgi:hypothetical protein
VIGLVVNELAICAAERTTPAVRVAMAVRPMTDIALNFLAIPSICWLILAMENLLAARSISLRPLPAPSSLSCFSNC